MDWKMIYLTLLRVLKDRKQAKQALVYMMKLSKEIEDGHTTTRPG